MFTRLKNLWKMSIVDVEEVEKLFGLILSKQQSNTDDISSLVRSFEKHLLINDRCLSSIEYHAERLASIEKVIKTKDKDLDDKWLN